MRFCGGFEAIRGLPLAFGLTNLRNQSFDRIFDHKIQLFDIWSIYNQMSLIKTCYWVGGCFINVCSLHGKEVNDVVP